MWRRVFSNRAEKMTVGGIDVLTDPYSNAGRAVAVRARLGLALGLIDQYAPRTGARLRGDIVGIVVSRGGGIAFNVIARSIQLDLRHAMVGTAEDLALMLVHEGTHARQRAMGIRMAHKGKDGQRRMEAQAVKQSIAFADRLPPGLWTRPTMESLNTPWWSAEQRAGRVAEHIRDLNLPAWCSRFAVHAIRLLGLGR